MKRWTAGLLVVAAGLLSGCCCSCPGDCVPVSMEGCYDFLNHYGRCYHHFPYSCPPCPYYSGMNNGYRLYTEHDVRHSEQAPVPADEEGAGDYYDRGESELPEATDEVPPTPEPED